MLSNCGAGEDSWESLGQQGDQASSQSERKSVLNIHWKDLNWSLKLQYFGHWLKEPTHWKRPWCWEGLRAGGEGATEDETVGWHHRLNWCEFDQTLEEARTEEPGVLQSMGSQRVGYSWAIEQRKVPYTVQFIIVPHLFCNWKFLPVFNLLHLSFSPLFPSSLAYTSLFSVSVTVSV